MRDLYLRFADEAAFLAARDDELIVPVPGLVEIDVIGTIFEEVAPAQFDEEGAELVPAVLEPRPGWRVNLRVRDDRDLSALEPVRVFPATPIRVWA